MTSEESKCPMNCPNRKGNGITLFGWHIDPLEMLLHCLVILILGMPAVRNATDEDFDVNEALKWLGAIVGISTMIRLSPTDRVNAYLQLKPR